MAWLVDVVAGAVETVETVEGEAIVAGTVVEVVGAAAAGVVTDAVELLWVEPQAVGISAAAARVRAATTFLMTVSPLD